MLIAVFGAARPIQAQNANSPYPGMAPIEQYRMDRDAGIVLARTAAPPSISRDASARKLCCYPNAERATRFDLPPSRRLIIVSYRHQRAGRRASMSKLAPRTRPCPLS